MDLQTAVRDFAAPATLTLTLDESLQQATASYLRSGLDTVPVLNESGCVVGMFGLAEAARLIMQKERAASAD